MNTSKPLTLRNNAQRNKSARPKAPEHWRPFLGEGIIITLKSGRTLDGKLLAAYVYELLLDTGHGETLVLKGGIESIQRGETRLPDPQNPVPRKQR